MDVTQDNNQGEMQWTGTGGGLKEGAGRFFAVVSDASLSVERRAERVVQAFNSCKDENELAACRGEYDQALVTLYDLRSDVSGEFFDRSFDPPAASDIVGYLEGLDRKLKNTEPGYRFLRDAFMAMAAAEKKIAAFGYAVSLRTASCLDFSEETLKRNAELANDTRAALEEARRARGG